jgi:hypothetical protein
MVLNRTASEVEETLCQIKVEYKERFSGAMIALDER